MVWIATVAVVRPSDGKIVKVNADEVIFYTNRGWKLASNVGKTSGGEQTKTEDKQLLIDREATADSDINAIHEANAAEVKDKSTDGNQSLNDIII